MARRGFRRLRSVGIGLGLAVASSGVALGVAEVAASLWLRDAPPQVLRPIRRTIDGGGAHVFDPVIGWRLRPGYADELASVNAQGFRADEEYRFDAGRPARTVLLLGDSMVYGLLAPQRDIFAERLAARHPGAQFVNAGVVGYSTLQEYVFLRDNFERMRPDAVVVYYTQANDMWHNGRDDHFHPSAELTPDGLRVGPARPVHEPRPWERLTLYRLLDARLLRGRDVAYLRDRLAFALRGEDSESWRLTRRILVEMRRVARRVPMLLYDIPTQNQLGGTAADRTRQALLRRACAAEGIEYFDLSELYPDDWRPLFVPGDSHWSAAGHRLVADHLEAQLLRLGVLPGAPGEPR